MADPISAVMKMNGDINGTLRSIAGTSRGKKFEAPAKRYDCFYQCAADVPAKRLRVKRDMAAASMKDAQATHVSLCAFYL